MRKQYTVDLRITTSNPGVVATIGAVAEAVEKQYADDIQDMSVSTHAHVWKPEYGDTLTSIAEPPAPPPEPDPAKAESPRKRGRVKPEATPPSAPEPTAPENMELPLPEPAIEGADAELSEPVTSGTRELTRDDVFEALRALVVGKGNAAAVRALQSVGVAKFSDCPTDRLADLFDAIQKEAA